MTSVWVGDLEGDGLLPTVSRIWCGVFEEVYTGERVQFLPHEIEAMLRFLDTVDVWIAHNGLGYDKPALEKCYGYTFKGKLIDTLVMSRLFRPKRPANSVEYWGNLYGLYKQEHEDWSQYSEDMLRRCHRDVDIQRKMWTSLTRESKGFFWKNALAVNFKLAQILEKSQAYGWKFDQEYGQKCISTLDRWVSRIDRAVDSYLPVLIIKEEKGDNYVKKPFVASGAYHYHTRNWMDRVGIADGVVAGPYCRVNFRKVNLNSNDETKEFLLSQGWQPEKWNTNEAGERTSPKLTHTDPFLGINGKLGRLVARRVQCRHRKSTIEGWFRDIREDGRIGQVVTGFADTYRLRHAKIVNVPGEDAFFGKYMRACFVAKEGYKIVGTDSAGCQNRMLAARVGDPKFTDTLINGDKDKGTSIHQVNQQAIKAIADVDVSYRISKNCNYAFMFGASDKKLAVTANAPLHKGELIRKALLSISPGFAELVAKLTVEWRSNASRRLNKWNKLEYYDGWVTGLDGRPVYIQDEHTILVYVLQSDEAIMMQLALVMLNDWLEERGWIHGREWGFVCNMHDEIQAEVREDLAEEYAALAERAIVEAGKALNIACPHQGESKIGNNWRETH